MLSIDLQLPHSYEIEEVPELPGTGTWNVPLFYFPRPTMRSEHDGLWLRVQPRNCKSWVGVFAFGFASSPTNSRVLSTCDPERLCVVSRGIAYIVTADTPDHWEQVPIEPVLDVRYIPEHELLVFADFTRLTAFDSAGIRWTSPRLCWDDLKIVTVSNGIIEGIGYDPTDSSSQSRFAVNARTGEPLYPAPTSVDGRALW